MECKILPNSCRVCLKISNKLTSLHNTDEFEEPPLKMLFKLTGIILDHEDEPVEVPKQICRNCICELNLAYQFRQKALESQNLIDLFIKERFETIKENNEIETTSEVCFGTVNIIETTEILDLCEDNIVSLNERMKENGEWNTEELEPPNNAENNTEPCIIIRENQNQKQNNKFISMQEDKRAHLLKKSTSKNVQSNRGRKPKFRGDETSFICDICGNIFSKRSRLTEHRYRHETELRHSCELCGERFLVREMLRRHMFRHVGEKPYKCSYCTRSFFYESVKKSHEAVHAGLKPYVCKQCQRAFAYPQALKKHELIHADIKLYHCTYCNKDFRLKHHMIQHEKTTLHRNTVLAAKQLAAKHH